MAHEAANGVEATYEGGTYRRGPTVFIVEWSGCECGGACEVAFSTRESAEKWVEEQEAKDMYPRAVDFYDIKEVELR